jgi:hypothetical protein
MNHFYINTSSGRQCLTCALKQVDLNSRLVQKIIICGKNIQSEMPKKVKVIPPETPVTSPVIEPEVTPTNVEAIAQIKEIKATLKIKRKELKGLYDELKKYEDVLYN